MSLRVGQWVTIKEDKKGIKTNKFCQLLGLDEYDRIVVTPYTKDVTFSISVDDIETKADTPVDLIEVGDLISWSKVSKYKMVIKNDTEKREIINSKSGDRNIQKIWRCNKNENFIKVWEAK